MQIPSLAQFSLATERHQVNAFPVNSVTAILTILVGYVMPATLQNYWTLNVQLASFEASPSNFSGLSNLIFEPVSVPGPVAGWCWCWWCWWWCLLCCRVRSMPPLDYLINEVLRRLRRTQRNMSDLVIQVLIRKLRNIRHICLQTSTKRLEISSNRIYNSRNQMKAYVQASGTQAQVLALLSQQSFSVTNPGLKNDTFVVCSLYVHCYTTGTSL